MVNKIKILDDNSMNNYDKMYHIQARLMTKYPKKYISIDVVKTQLSGFVMIDENNNFFNLRTSEQTFFNNSIDSIVKQIDTMLGVY